jgi:hypothetical protein
MVTLLSHWLVTKSHLSSGERVSMCAASTVSGNVRTTFWAAMSSSTTTREASAVT